jgi:hypothetical protein
MVSCHICMITCVVVAPDIGFLCRSLVSCYMRQFLETGIVCATAASREECPTQITQSVQWTIVVHTKGVFGSAGDS